MKVRYSGAEDFADLVRAGAYVRIIKAEFSIVW